MVSLNGRYPSGCGADGTVGKERALFTSLYGCEFMMVQCDMEILEQNNTYVIPYRYFHLLMMCWASQWTNQQLSFTRCILLGITFTDRLFLTFFYYYFFFCLNHSFIHFPFPFALPCFILSLHLFQRNVAVGQHLMVSFLKMCICMQLLWSTENCNTGSYVWLS